MSMRECGVRTMCAMVLAASSGAAFAGTMGGTPLVALGEDQPTSWTEAMQSGRLFGVDPAMHGTPRPALDFYATQGNAAFVPAVLTPDLMVTLPSAQRGEPTMETHQSLVMQWNPPMQGEDVAVASWEYDTFNLGERVGGLDLRGGTAHFSLGAPPGVWDISFMLQDKNGNWSGWFMPMPPIGWSVQWIDFSQGAQGGWVHFQDPGFDLSNIIAVRLDEAGAIVQFPPPPAGAIPDIWDWNAFDHLIITPTPGAAVLLGASMLMAGVRRRRS